MSQFRLVFRVHTIQRMFQRRVSEEEVKQVVVAGETIETYPDDKPFPSRLMLARIIHEHFCCNREFAAATSLWRAGSPKAPSTYCANTPRGLATPHARLATRLRDFATNRHE